MKKSGIIHKLLNHKEWIFFAGVLIVAWYLRYYQIDKVIPFGYDQARDSWRVWNILHGNFMLIGPRAGVGYLYLGPLYFYFLAPFFFIFHYDPMASQYFNMVANLLNILFVFWVAWRLLGKNSAYFVLFLYTVSEYIIRSNQTPWNVSLMPGIAVLIFYGIVQVTRGNYKWVFYVWMLNGLYYHIHFTGLFLPVITLLSFLFAENKKKVFLYSLYSIPLYIVWFIPNIIYQVTTEPKTGELGNFFKYYFVGFHAKFLLTRISDSFVQFKAILGSSIPYFKPLMYIVPAIYAITVVFFEKDKKEKKMAILILFWFLVPLFAFSLYGGPLTDYYFLYQAPLVLFILAYLQKKMLQINLKVFLVLSALFWIFFAFENTKAFWIKPLNGGIYKQKQHVAARIRRGENIMYNEGDIEAYLYQVWKDTNKLQ